MTEAAAAKADAASASGVSAVPRAASSTPSVPTAASTPAPSIVVDASVADDGKEPLRAPTSDASGRVSVAREKLESGPNPFDDQVWRAEGGSDGEMQIRVRPASGADAELAGAHPVIAGNPIREALGAFVKNKRNVAIAAAGAVVLLLLIVLVAGGGSKTKHAGKQIAQQEAQTAAAKEPAKEPAPEPVQAETPAAGSDSNAAVETGAGSAEAATGSATEHADDTRKADTRKADTGEPEKKKATPFGGKQVVLDYDTQAREAKPVAGATQDEQSAIAKARGAYATGNSKLFAGDADGAIKAYRQALAYYPAYVAGYRGLGLAFAQKVDNAKAVQALRTYVGTVPSAKDAAIIRKRIQMLSGK